MAFIYSNEVIQVSFSPPPPSVVSLLCYTTFHLKSWRWFLTIQCLNARMRYSQVAVFRWIFLATLRFLIQKSEVHWLKCLWKMNPWGKKAAFGSEAVRRKKKKARPWGGETQWICFSNADCSTLCSWEAIMSYKGLRVGMHTGYWSSPLASIPPHFANQKKNMHTHAQTSVRYSAGENFQLLFAVQARCFCLALRPSPQTLQLF